MEKDIYEIDPENVRNPFEHLSSTPEEGHEELEDFDTSREGIDHRVCICGHPVKRHKQDRTTGLVQCSPNAQRCPCKRRVAVLKSSDLRVFLRSTRGVGWLHALGQGMLAAHDRGITMDWMVPDVCELCEKQAKVMPVSLNDRQKMDLMSGLNFLICDECMAKI